MDILTSVKTDTDVFFGKISKSEVKLDRKLNQSQNLSYLLQKDR